MKSKIVLMVLMCVLVVMGQDYIVPGYGYTQYTHRQPYSFETQIDHVPYEITDTGHYVLTCDVSAAGSAILIYHDSVTLDLNGYTITYGNGVILDTVTTFSSAQYGNIGHAGVVCPGDIWAQNAEDWSDIVVNNKNFKNIVLKNGIIKNGDGAGLGYSPGLLLPGMHHSIVQNILIYTDAMNSPCAILGYHSKHTNLTLLNNCDSVTNRHSLLGSILTIDRDCDTITKCIVYGSPQGGIRTDDSCIVYDNHIRTNSKYTNGYAVLVGDYSKVYNNNVKNIKGRGMSMGFSHCQFYNNYVEAREGYNAEYSRLQVHGFKVEGGTNCKAYNNIIVSIADTAGEPTPLNLGASTYDTIINNAFFGIGHKNSTYNCAIYSILPNCSTFVISNNLFRQNAKSTTTSFLMLSWDGGKNCDIDSCSFTCDTIMELVQHVNGKEARNFNFRDCIFNDSIDLYDTRLAPTTVQTDWSIRYSLNIVNSGACSLYVVDIEKNDTLSKTEFSGNYKVWLPVVTDTVYPPAGVSTIDSNIQYFVKVKKGANVDSFNLIPKFSGEYYTDSIANNQQVLLPTTIQNIYNNCRITIPLQSTGTATWNVTGNLPSGLVLSTNKIVGKTTEAGSDTITLSDGSSSKRIIFNVVDLVGSRQSRIDSLYTYGFLDTMNMPAKSSIEGIYSAFDTLFKFGNLIIYDTLKVGKQFTATVSSKRKCDIKAYNIYGQNVVLKDSIINLFPNVKDTIIIDNFQTGIIRIINYSKE